MRHELKTWPVYFEAMRSGKKRFELRRDDRGFKVGDTLVLREWQPGAEAYTGRTIEVQVIYTLKDAPGLGLLTGFCIMSTLRA